MVNFTGVKMKFLGCFFTLAVLTFVVGFFANWFDVSKGEGTVSVQVNTRTIGHDLNAAGKAVKSLFKKD